MANDLTTTTPSRALKVFDAPLTPTALTALRTANKLREKYSAAPNYGFLDIRNARMVPTAITARNERLADFVAADEAAITLFHLNFVSVQRPVAAEMVSTLYRAIGIKPGEELAGMLEGALDMIESDAVGKASGLWRPVNVTPAALALACRKLIATAKWVKPAELREACDEARRMLRFAEQVAEHIRDSVQQADAILLEFAYDEWQRPWLMPEYRPALTRMLELHDPLDDDDPLAALVEREKAKLLALEHKEPPKKIAAARKRSERKRSAKQTNKQAQSDDNGNRPSN